MTVSQTAISNREYAPLSWLPELLGEPDKNSFGAPDVAETIGVFVLDYFAYEFRAALAEPFKRLIDVVHGEHHPEIA